ncbi:3-oxoacyl-reductase [Cadophora sp. MPI-SDFR-AT-0126]|nr:3-oxoacyl-reductase [Leptodontidium sp. MPI-SDFR-AT-0119]KAH7378977.1 3-oxoacyl-reductase [Leotiomycetes sp. MPI-SDFR-AT-0126]
MSSQQTNSNPSLAGKVAIISGSSAGIGAAIARELSKRGATVVINYPFPSEEADADKVKESLGPQAKAITVEADLSTTKGPQTLADAAAAAFGKIDILVNNAGIAPHIAFDELDNGKIEELWSSTINLNSRGVFLLSRAVLKYLSPQNSRIVNIASSASRTPVPGQSLYVGSKGFVEALTRVMAVELPRKYNCTVNAVAPGPVGTETYLASPVVVAGHLNEFVEATPVAARVAKPEEVAYVVAALCEEGANWVNGATIPVTGGTAF